MDSRYFNQFNRLNTEGKKLFTMRGNTILVEVLEEHLERVSEGGIIFAADAEQITGTTKEKTGEVGLVLLVGEGYYDEKSSDTIPLDLKPGNVVLLPRYSLSYYSFFPGLATFTKDKLAMCSEDEIRFVYQDLQAYEEAKKLLNA